MDKYERHNEKQMAKYRGDWTPPFTFISRATFDLFEKHNPALLDSCMVTMLVAPSPEEAVERYSIFTC